MHINLISVSYKLCVCVCAFIFACNLMMAFSFRPKHVLENNRIKVNQHNGDESSRFKSYLHSSPAPYFETFQVFLICFLKCPKFQHHTKLCMEMVGSSTTLVNLYQTVLVTSQKTVLFRFSARYQGQTEYILTYVLIAWSRVLLEKLTGFAADQEIPRILWNP